MKKKYFFFILRPSNAIIKIGLFLMWFILKIEIEHVYYMDWENFYIYEGRFYSFTVQ